MGASGSRRGTTTQNRERCGDHQSGKGLFFGVELMNTFASFFVWTLQILSLACKIFF
jgi:hypothetical protein